MSELEELENWFVELDHLLWDRQIESDAKSGKLGRLVNEALADYMAGKAKKI